MTKLLEEQKTTVEHPEDIEKFDQRELAEDIAQVYQDQYVNYPFPIDNPSHVEEEWMPSNNEVYVVLTDSGTVTFKDDKEDIVLDEPEVVGTGAIAYDHDEHTQELGRAGLKDGFVRPENRSFYSRLLEERIDKARENMKSQNHPAEITFTQPVLAHSATQYHNGVRGFAAVGNSVKKYNEVFDPEVRASVGQMIDADSNFRNPSSDEEVFFNENLREMIDYALDNLNQKRDNDLENLSRTLIGEQTQDYDLSDLIVKEEMYDRKESGEHGLGIASYKVSTSNELEENGGNIEDWQSLENLKELGSILDVGINDEEIEYMNVKIDGNNPQAYDVSNELIEKGFAGEAFMPEMFRYNDGVSDQLSLQYFEGDVEATLFPEFYELAERQPNLTTNSNSKDSKGNYETILGSA